LEVQVKYILHLNVSRVNLKV